MSSIYTGVNSLYTVYTLDTNVLFLCRSENYTGDFFNFLRAFSDEFRLKDLSIDEMVGA